MPPVQPERLMPVVAVVVAVLPEFDVEFVFVDVVLMSWHTTTQQVACGAGRDGRRRSTASPSACARVRRLAAAVNSSSP